MRQDVTSATGLGPVEPDRILSLAKDEVECPSCGRMCHFYGAYFTRGGDVFTRCLTSVGGCGTNFTFESLSGRLVSFVAPSKLSEGLETGKAAERAIATLSEAETDRRVQAETQESEGWSDASDGCPGDGSQARLEEARNNLIMVHKSCKNELNPDYEKTYCTDFGEKAVGEKLAGFHRRKLHAQKVADCLSERGREQEAGKVRVCCSEVVLRRFLESPEGQQVKVAQADWCQKRILCNSCEKARAARTIGKWVPKIIEACTTWNLVPWMVTLTVKNGESLKARMDHIFGALTRAANRRKNVLQARQSKPSEFAKIQGAVWHLEIKRGKRSGLWHPHLHGICLLRRDAAFNFGVVDGNVIPDRLSREWMSVTRDSKIVHAVPTKFGNEMMHNPDLTASGLFEDPAGKEKLISDCLEIMKYCLKYDPDQDVNEIVDAYDVCKGKRLLRAWGSLRGLKKEDKAKGDLTGVGEYIEYVNRWCGETQSYKLHRTSRGLALSDEEEAEVEEIERLAA